MLLCVQGDHIRSYPSLIPYSVTQSQSRKSERCWM